MINVFFENVNGEKRSIGTVLDRKEAYDLIDDFLKERNFKSYYKRWWQIDERTSAVDVGSWYERFYLEEI